MNILLLFFALPVATILLAIVLQKILCSPILVAITAAIVRFLRRFFRCQNHNNCDDDDDDDSCNNDSCDNCDNDSCNNNGGNNNNCSCERICNCLRESGMFGSRGRRCGR